MGADAIWIMGFAGKYPVLDFFGVFFAEYLPYFIIIILAVVFLLQRDLRQKLYLIFFTTLSIILASGVIRAFLNYFLYRPRPFVAYSITPLIEQPATASFPSGHATLMFTLATVVFLLLSRRAGLWLYGAALLIGLARVYAGVHYPLDIVGGAALGIISPFIVRWLLPKHLLRTPSAPVPTEATTQ